MSLSFSYYLEATKKRCFISYFIFHQDFTISCSDSEIKIILWYTIESKKKNWMFCTDYTNKIKLPVHAELLYKQSM